MSLEAVTVTAARRWYVLLFLAVYLVAALRHLGARRAALFSVSGFAIAWASEVPSIRWGFPYGLYRYLWAPGEPRGLDPREPALLGVPVFSDLSYVFLGYAALCLAAHLAGGGTRRLATALVAAVLFVALDAVIDPVALRGGEWFLGKIYDYPHGGSHFGVPLSNYAGWLFVGIAMQLSYLSLERRLPGPPERGSVLPGVLLYFGVCAFNVGVAASIGARDLAFAGAAIAAPLAAIAAARPR
jgi:putative membrane protein